MSFRLVVRSTLVFFLLSCAFAAAQSRSRHNFYGMHNLKDGGAPIPEGMNWTRHMVGEGGYVFDWVRGDYGRWVVDAMDRGLIPCLRIQDCNGGCDPDPGYPEIVANVIRQHLEQYRPQYVDRLVYLQLWNEPGDQRDLVTPERFADFLVAAHAGVKRADTHGVFRTMTPGQNGPEWWRKAIRHNPAACQAFDVWATHPYPESYPPHYNHHDGVPFINQVKTIDSYLLDLDAVASECAAQGSPRRGFPVMVTETAYGDRLGISYEGYPKTTRGPACSTDGPCQYGLASQYNVAAFTEFWQKWPEILAVHPFILNNWSWDPFAFVSRGSGSRDDKPVPSWCPPEDIVAGTPFPPGYSTGARRCGLPTGPYPQYKALLDIQKPTPSSLTPYRGPVGTLRGRVSRKGTGAPVKFATVATDGYEFGGPTLSDGIYVARDVPAGTYSLSVEKEGYASTSKSVTVVSGRETVVDFDLDYLGKVSKGIYFQNQGTCSNCNLYAPFLGQSFQVPDDVGFIKFAAAMPNVGNVEMKFTILKGGPTGSAAGPSVTAYLEWGGEMIGAEWPGDGVPVTPGDTYFLKVERADGQGVYLYATDANPFAGGMAFTGTTAHPAWDLFATLRGKTVASTESLGLVTGIVEDESNAPVSGATVASSTGVSSTTSSTGEYSLSLPAGTYTLTASRSGYTDATETGVTVVTGQTTVVSFTLALEATTGSIEGRVETTGGSPLSGALVATASRQATTDANGHFVLDSLPAGTYTLSVSRAGFEEKQMNNIVVQAGLVTSLTIALTALPAPDPQNLVTNGDFASGLEGWSLWVERGSLTPTVDGNGRLRLASQSFNGGVYQRFSTGGAGRTLDVSGFWASSPTVANAQWAEVLVINGSRNPVNGQDIANGAPDVVLLFKNDTWTLPQGWSGSMASTGKVQNRTSFVAASDVATIVLKTGNIQGASTGALFDDIVVRGPAPANRAPTASFTFSPSTGTAPLAVSFDGSASSDPDGDSLTYAWSFGDGSQGSGVKPSHTYANAGTFSIALTVQDGRGGSHAQTKSVVVSPATTPSSLITNGDFAQGLTGWSVWTERGNLAPVISSGRLKMGGSSHNGGVYQTFATGGAGREIRIDGFWATDPTQRQAQWGEVLIINGSRKPVNGQDVSASASDVVLVYKNDTWASPSGWSGSMRSTAAVAARGSFVSAGSIATIILKSGNVLGATSGMVFDDVVVTGPGGPPPNRPPTAAATGSPTSGIAPLAVAFDARGSSDPDGDALSFSWSFGDGTSGTGATANHSYASPGSFTAVVTVTDGRGGTASASVGVSVTSPGSPPGVPDWDSRLTSLGLQVKAAVVPAGTWYWKLVSARFESDGEILPPPGGGSESNGTHAIYYRAQNPDGSFLAGQQAVAAWPNGNPTNFVSITTKGAVDGYWGDFPMAGGWCPFYPDGGRGPYGAWILGSASDEVWGMGMPCNRHVSYRFVWKWTQKDSGQSKLSIHAGFGGPKSMEFVRDAKPRIVKILDAFSAAPEVKRLSPSTLVIGRAYSSQQPMDGDPVQRAREWWDRTKSLVLQYPSIDYWEGYNEPVIQTPALMQWYAAFEAERVRILAQNGRKACIANFSVGNPDLPLWPNFYAAIDAAKANGGILGLHEYGTPMQQYFDEASGEGWFTGRYRKLYRQFLIPAGKVIPLAVTETGVDVVQPVGWKNHFTEEQYLDQLKWYDRVLLEDDYVLGATIFALEIPGWYSFDIAPIADRLKEYVRPK